MYNLLRKMIVFRNVGHGSFNILFPHIKEALEHYDALPTIRFPFKPLCRVLEIGETRGEIPQLSQVTHVSDSSKIRDVSWIKPDRSSWSFWIDTQSWKEGIFNNRLNFLQIQRWGSGYGTIQAYSQNK